MAKRKTRPDPVARGFIDEHRRLIKQKDLEGQIINVEIQEETKTNIKLVAGVFTLKLSQDAYRGMKDMPLDKRHKLICQKMRPVRVVDGEEFERSKKAFMAHLGP